jgi:protein disulfide-isomerase
VLRFVVMMVGAVLLCVGLGAARPPMPKPAETQSGGIAWMTNYGDAVDKAKKAELPILLYFTGSDWCQWCQKMDSTILSDPSFVEKVRGHFVFVKLDFPMKSEQNENVAKTNARLQEQFQVKGFPTIVIVNAKGDILGETGYRDMSPDMYADTLLSMAQRGSDYVKMMNHFDPKNLTVDQLRDLYQEAELLGRSEDSQRILTAALEKAPADAFFLAQKYRCMLEAGRYGTPDAVALRQQLLSSSPNQAQELAFFVAFLDFRALAESSSNHLSADKVLAPMQEFLTQHQGSSPFHWRVEMIMGEYLATRGGNDQALAHLKRALAEAPERAKAHIQQSIDLLQTPKEQAVS